MEQNKMPLTPWKLIPRIQKDRDTCPVDYFEICNEDAPWWIAHIKASDGGEEAAKAIVAAVNCTHGASINPEAVPALLESLKWVRESPQFKRMDWKLKVTIDAAIEKAIIK